MIQVSEPLNGYPKIASAGCGLAIGHSRTASLAAAAHGDHTLPRVALASETS
jgi:hypothetical protein